VKYEKCSSRLIMEFAKILDPDRKGVAIDIGVGSGKDYFVELANNGFQTFAVEPLPPDDLLPACREHGVTLETAAISDEDGYVTMYLGQYHGKRSMEMSSLNPDWWASSSDTQEVPSLKLDSFLTKWAIKKISVLKMDTEGSEFTITNQFRSISRDRLPSLVQFEYGGGAPRYSQLGGWSAKYFQNTCAGLEVLRSLGYEWLLLVDGELPTVKTFWLSDINDFAEVFHPMSGVGNAIVCKDGRLRHQVDIVDLCKPYIDYQENLVKSLLRLGSEESTHSFKWILPYVIAQQYEIQRRPLRILEYGPGCNSEQFLNSLVCQHLVSIEDNLEWYNEYASLMSAFPEVNVDYRLIEVKSAEGKAYCGGHCWTEAEILAYSQYPSKYGSNYFDVIFIDSGDRGDEVTTNGRRYTGWPIRNLCLELAHSLLNENGVVVIHDVPGPWHRMNSALADNIQTFKYAQGFEEFQTTVLSDSLDLTSLGAQIRKLYQLSSLTQMLSRFFNQRGRAWHNGRFAKLLMKTLLRFDVSSRKFPLT